MALKNIPNEVELQFTTAMINDNFSSYSAWHNLCILLNLIYDCYRIWVKTRRERLI